ncbi:MULTISPECIES: hypothetical protein [unclassified Rhizobium]|uniref:hypothetical protein n=1 Tax=unclassified Rhizobium TaxID=2613769 RepID=UPI0017EBCD5C|nr:MULTISPECIES: hypothetical protein [unclassified Rhizobium]MBB3541008.1 hypothetical protein [Rhizobium sp. BK399]MCS3741335.1 hypothetical protein [Rhizobium sp. BK661]MCS4093788.1 hypothetical protein [Rhizobium sp. BK176]
MRTVLCRHFTALLPERVIVRTVKRDDHQLLWLIAGTRHAWDKQGKSEGGFEKRTKHGHRDNLFAAFLLQKCGEAAVALAFFCQPS